MIKKILCLCLIINLCLIILGCSKSSSITGGVTGTAKLEGTSDYTGIVVTVLDTTQLITTTASDGSYSISDVPAGTVTLNFSRGGYASQSKVIIVTAGTTTNVDTVTLSQSYGGLIGTAKLEGQTDHSGITVSISINGYTGTATTNSSGEYSFSNLTPGTVTINFSKSGFNSMATTNTVTAYATANVSTVTLNISLGSVSGTITIGGSAIQGMTVTIQGTSTSTTTDSNGNFSFSDVSPGTYTLVFTHDEYITQTQEVTVTAGESTSIDPITFTSIKGSITGTINLYGQTDHSGATVSVNGTSLAGTTATDGSFTISDVPTGTYTITITKSGFSTTTQNVVVEAGESTDLGTVNSYAPGGVWTQATDDAGFSGRMCQSSVVYDNKMWVIGGEGQDGGNRTFSNDVWYSSDGVTWTQATASANFNKRYRFASVVFDNKMWVVGGADENTGYKDVWYSTDGVTWTQATASANFNMRQSHSLVVFNNKMWVIGGHAGSPQNWSNDVWYSSDGVTWTQATDDAGFTARLGHTCVVFNDKMWVIGGSPDWSETVFEDIWYSSDGVTWTQVTDSADFGARSEHSCLVYNNKIYVIGGVIEDGSTPPPDDVWSSSDGINWTQVTDSFTGISFDECVVFNNKIWSISGGVDNQVWYSN